MNLGNALIGTLIAVAFARGAGARTDTVSFAELTRAAALMRNNPATVVHNTRIVPHWIGGGRRFWYQRDVASGHDYVVVDAETGAKALAFDHDAVARTIARTSGIGVAADRLTVLAIGASSVDLSVGGRNYRCDLQGSACSALPSIDPGVLLSPDGRLELFRRADNLWLRRIDTGAERQLTTDGAAQFGYGMPSDRYDQNKLTRDRLGTVLPPAETWWSPDSRHIVTARLDQRQVAAYPYLENAPRDDSFRPVIREVRLPLMGERSARLDWWVIDAETAAKRPIDFPVNRMIAANNGIDDLKISWDADSSHLLAISGMTDFVGAEAFSVDLATGHTRVIMQDRSTPGNPLVAGGYGRPIARFVAEGRELLWWSERDGWGHVYRYDTATGRLINRVTQGPWLVRDIVAVDEARRQLWFTGMGREPGNPYNRYLYRIDLDGRHLQLMTPEIGDHMIVDPTGSPLVFDGAGPTDVVAPNFRSIVYDVSSIGSPTQTILRRATDGARVATVEQADASGLLSAGYRTPEEFKARTADGTDDLYGLVYRPSDYNPKHRYPVIDVEYGNPAVAITPHIFQRAAIFSGTAATPAALAELGFVVVVVDARGTPFRSRAFSHAGPGYLATMGLDDHIAFIRAIAASDPGIDLDRVGIAGQSFGGYTALRALVEYPEFFKVGVAGSPQTAYHNMAAEAVLTASEGPPRYEGGGRERPTRLAIPENFKPLDTAEQLDRLKGHILIIAGEQDENVYPGTIVQFMDRAIRDNRHVDMIWMPNTAHDGLFTPYALTRSIEYLTRYLQGRLLPDALPPLPSPTR